MDHSKWRLKLYPIETSECNCFTIEIEKLDGISNASAEILFYLLTSKGPFYLGKIEEREFRIDDTFIIYPEKKELRKIIKDGSVFYNDGTLVLKCHLRSKNKLFLPLVVSSSLTQFDVEYYCFNCSLKIFEYYELIPWEKIIFPKSKNLPQIKILVFRNNNGYMVISLKNIFENMKFCFRVKFTVSLFNLGNVIVRSDRKDCIVAPLEEMILNLGNCSQLQSSVNAPGIHLKLFNLRFEIAIASNEIFNQIVECDGLSNPEHNMDKHMEKETNNQMVEIKVPFTSKISENHGIGFDSLMDDLSLLLKEKKLSDVTLRTYGKEFFAHRAILSIRSPVFSTMFESNMKEKETGLVCIDDIDAEIFELFLKYLYLGKLDDVSEKRVISLYSAADKYQVVSLKSECSSFILDHLCEENICDVLILSDMHQDEELKLAAQKAFCIYSKNILLSNGWATLMLKYPELATETLREMARNMQ